MVNDCVRIGLKDNLTSMKSLCMKAYYQLSAYDVPTCYRLTAISRATGILRNYRKELKKNRSARFPMSPGSLSRTATASGSSTAS